MDLPWISIITPSGTGKTQLPYSLQHPSLYICLQAHRKKLTGDLQASKEDCIEN